MKHPLVLSLFVVGLQFTIPALAAIPSLQTRQALQLSSTERVDQIRTQGAQGYRNLRDIMFDEKQSMTTRWRAVMTASQIAGKESVPELERALKSREWFMRNAGLVAYVSVDRGGAIRSARRLLSDKALVVRTAAVETLMDLRDSGSADLLWKKLYAPENFHNKQSLFIRRRIVEALMALKPAGADAQFVKVLSDRDEDLQRLAIVALESINQNTLGNSRDSLKTKRELWQKWWQAKNQTSPAARTSSSM